jgi:nucleoside-diphosphate-sugar epimerase
VRDVVEGIVLAFEKETAIGEIFNLFAAEATTWEAAVRYIHAQLGRPLIELSLPIAWAFRGDITKARQLLGYNPQYDFRRMIDDAIAFAQGQDIGVEAG